LKDASMYHRIGNTITKEKRRKIKSALKESNNDIAKAAAIMEVSIQTINRSMILLHLT